MLKINLLPETARKATLSPIEQFHRTPLMWIALVVMGGLPLMLVIPLQMYRQQLQQLTVKVNTLEPQRAAVDQLQRTLQQLRDQEAAFRGMAKGQGLWAKQLNSLSNLTPNGVWFTDLTLDQTKGLVIQGAAIGQADPEMANVTKLVRDLETDANFSSAVKDIQIESIKRVPEGDFEVVHFTLTCSLIEAPGP